MTLTHLRVGPKYYKKKLSSRFFDRSKMSVRKIVHKKKTTRIIL